MKISTCNIKNAAKQHWLFAFSLLATTIFLLWKCQFGFGNIDESFYITIPYRLLQGDALFSQEWHLSQMAGIISLPFVAIYVGITGGTEGIVLYMRCICILMQLLTALFLYSRLYKFHRFGALVVSIASLLYVPFGITALSYNSTAIWALLVSVTMVLTAQKHRTLQFVIAGFLYALAVLCCPYLAIVFLLYLTGVGLLALRDKIRHTSRSFSLFHWKGALLLTAGAAIAAAAFAIFVLSRASVSEILAAFPHILDDPEHPPITFLGICQKFIFAILGSASLAKYIYTALALLFITCLLDKKRLAHRLIYFLPAFAGTLVLMLQYRDINHIMWPLNVLAVFAAILTKEKTFLRIFWPIWLLGMLYAFCLNASSNQAFRVIASASAVSLAGSIPMIFLFFSEVSGEAKCSLCKGATIALISLLMLLQLGSQFYLRYTTVFWETGRPQEVKIDVGASKGLYASKASYDAYMASLKTQEILQMYEPEKVLFLSWNTWNYLNTEYEIGSYSAWLSDVNEHTIARLKQYYILNPDKRPDVVCADLHFREMAMYFCTECGYEVSQEDDFLILVPAN